MAFLGVWAGSIMRPVPGDSSEIRQINEIDFRNILICVFIYQNRTDGITRQADYANALFSIRPSERQL
ncbi:hypothetical protein BL240_15690 [Pseudomonas putida]|uniref:Uncharacterized protein n=1 Tax=Pseudomonas putida TaxID=303 RepID=A0A1L5PRP1_PSEPU|nr:hypothetical protein BL240_15690 [Pseudomonas putida]